MKKRLIFLSGIGLMLALYLAVWATNGFQNFTIWRSKPLNPFLLAFGLIVGPGLISLRGRGREAIAQRTPAELAGRGFICGLMLIVLLAAFAHWPFLAVKYDYRIVLGVGAFLASLGIGWMAIVNDAFLRDNLVAVGWLTALGGAIGYGVGKLFPEFNRPATALFICSAGIAFVLVVTYVTGRISYWKMIDRWTWDVGGSDKHDHGTYVRAEITRENDASSFGAVLMVLSGLLVFVLYFAIRALLTK